MRYIINPGESFRDSDGTVKAGGDEIELDDDMARVHAGKVTPMPVPAAPLDQPAAAAE
jgi:hypothetical protein